MTARRVPRTALHVVLFFATFFTTTATGALTVHADAGMFPLRDGLAFSVPLMAILLCHELGHYFAARHHGVPASLPFFIPLPPGFGVLGTMGAVITQGGTPDRRKLMDIGAAGPLAGLIVAVPVLIYGLSLSKIVQPTTGGLLEGNSLLYASLKRVMLGRWLPAGGDDVQLHPTALAGWGGLLVTMLNLLPIGQLDGGHVATAYFGNRYERAARALHRSLPILTFLVFAWVYWAVRQEAGSGELPGGFTAVEIAVYASLVWLVWYVMLLAMRRMTGGRYHPAVDEHPLPHSRAALFWVMAIVYALVFMPVPIRLSVAPDASTPPAAASPAPRVP